MESPAGISSGRCWVQRGMRAGQRGLKAQPEGMAFRRGMLPSIWASVSALLCMEGIEPIRPRV